MRKFFRSVLFTLVLLSLCALNAFLIYLYFFGSKEQDLSGEWTADLDMSEQAAVTAYIWLQDIEGVSVSPEEVESRIPELTVEVNMKLEQTGQAEGTFQCMINQDSYDACDQAAYEAFAAAFRELTAERLRMAGYEGSTEEEDVEALAAEAFGMSTVSYLRTCAPALLPSLEELQAEYDGSGTYETAEGILIRRSGDENGAVTRSESYIREEEHLILIAGSETEASGFDDHPVVYTLKQAQQQPAAEEQ